MIGQRTLYVRKVLLLLAGLAVSPLARADEPNAVVLSGESRATTVRLAEARKRLEQRKWSEAIDELQSILSNGGDDLVALTAERSVQARRLCQVHLASLPTDALRQYRQRYETQSRKKLELAQANRDVDSLRKVVNESFCTRAAEKALDRLGDLAFERGRFDEAEEWWRLLSPLPDARRDAALRGFALVYPDLTLDPARIQAKQLLARLFRDPQGEWGADLDSFRARHGKATGELAGRKGVYADLLQALADERKKEGVKDDPNWFTFGGDPARGRVIRAPDDILDRLSALCRSGPTWCFDLQKGTRQEGYPSAPADNVAQARTLAFHPAIVGHRVFVADARFVRSYDLRTGISSQYDVKKKNGLAEPNLNLPAAPDLRYTLTVADDRVYVRLGAQDIGLEAPPKNIPLFGQLPRIERGSETFLSCLKPSPDGEDRSCLWCMQGMAHDKARYEGAPLVANGRIWIASIRYNGDRCISSIDCYPTDETNEPPLRWRRDVCTCDAKPGEPRLRHHLLTLAGSQIVYCSHSGAVVAVDARIGRTNWAIRYPRRIAEKDDNTWKDLAPVLFASGRLYVAPADSDRLLCLDPATGRTLWEREAMKVVHLLGVGQGRLIFSTCDGLRAVGAVDGSDGSGWSIPQIGGGLTPAGRGLLIGDLVLWPTVRKRNPFSTETVVYAVRQRDGLPADDPALLHRLPAGNLAYANGCLVVADQRTLSIFVPPSLLLPERKDETRRHRESVPALLDSARRAASARRWEDTEAALRQALAAKPSARSRLHVLTRAAQIWREAGQTARARAVWETILADKSLRQIQVIDKNGTPSSAADCANDAIARLDGKRPTRLPRSSPRVVAAHARDSLPLFRTWHTMLEPDEWILAGWGETDPELLLTGGAIQRTGSPEGHLLCRSTSTGEQLWRHPLPFVPCWAGCHADTILTAGERGAACLRRDNGELLWHFPAPAPGRYPRTSLNDFRVIEDPQTPESLTAFRLVSGRLFFLQGQRRLFALDAETGRILWNQWAPDGRFHLAYPRGCFSPCYRVSAETVLLHMEGERWLLDAATGRQIHRAADGRELWRRAPLELDEHTLCVVSDNRHVVLLDSLTGSVQWTHTLSGGSTLSGEPPLVLGRGDLLLLVTPTNIGYYLQRLDRATGKAVWLQSPLLSTMPTLDASTWAFDSDAVYSVEDRWLIAHSVADGTVLWRRELETAGLWRIRRVGDVLKLYPSPDAVGRRFRLRSPFGAVQWELGPLLTPGTPFAVSCLNPKTGQAVQRLNFRIEAAARTRCDRRRTQADGVRSLVVQSSSLLASEDGPVVRLAGPRPFVAVGGEVWGLTIPTEVRRAERR